MKKDHLKDFLPDDKGGYVYRGERYRCLAGSAGLTALLKRLWPLTILLVASVVAGGCIPAPGMGNCAYLLLPYVAEVGVAGSVVWAAVRLQAGEYPLRGYIYSATVTALPKRCVATACMAALGAAGEVVYLALHGSGGNTVWAMLLLLLKAAEVLAALLARRLVRGSEWKIDGAA